jgi:hypothetical protein
MRAVLAVAGLLLGLAWPAVAGASGDTGCAPAWKLSEQQFACANRIVIGPANDSRVNLLLLLRERGKLDGSGLAYFEPEWSWLPGHALFEWDQLVFSLYPAIAPTEPGGPAYDPSDLSGSRCQSVRSGGAQFLGAVERNRVIPAGDRRALAEGREKLAALCEAQAGQRSDDDPVTVADLELPRLYASREGREFGTYLAGAAAFYLEDWDGARSRFASLRTAKDAWLVETARYMGARAELNAAAAGAFDEWGSFDLAAADKDAAARAGSGFAGYLEAYPHGRYAASAAGLVRRALWLQGDTAALGAAYAGMLERVDAASPAAVELVQEIDLKYLLDAGEAGGRADAGPWLVAAHDLLRMRNDGVVADDFQGRSDYYEYGLPPLTAAELTAQRAAFAGNAALYEFVSANYAFYVDHDYRAVLQLLPDDARKPSYSPLQFSRQVLRGMALAELKDRNEAGFWLELIGGAKGLYQRQTVELGLALAWERSGQVAKVFEPHSPIEDEGIRDMLLQYSAGPDVLRAVAQLAERPQGERDRALYVLLYKELSRGAYTAALRDFALVRSDAPVEWSEDGPPVLLGVFARGRFAEDYPCPALAESVAQLVRDPRAVKPRLCLGEFYRLNGFDSTPGDDERPEGELGSFASYPGRPVSRDRIYRDVIGEAGVAHADRAYALYRVIYCYAPTGANGCSGEAVPESERRRWFRRLKGEFGDTRWGREIEYYW